MSIARVQDALPGNGGRIQVEAGKCRLFVHRQFTGGLGGINAQLVQSCHHDATKALLVRWTEASIECFVALRRFMKEPRVNGSRQQVVGSRDGMNVSRQMQIEFFHRNNLRVAASGGTTLDAKGGTLGGLTNASKGGFAQHSSQRLGQSNRCGGFAFSEWRRINASDDHVVAVGGVRAAIASTQWNLGLGNAPGNDFVSCQADLLGKLCH
mmetsp:Transcript_2770/g.4463  ORF Transcript_2770/g.4463 Transcript_2770/m.4463 type:complete len:210 (-) Transcript_2770:338-967(-)